MKRNKLFLLGLIALFAAILSLSLVSNTFAKYTSTHSNGDTARVAKWGVIVSVNGQTFAKTHQEDGAQAATVISTESNVLAPGTDGKLAAISVTGTPEVASKVTYDAEVTISGWAVTGDDFYCPLEVTIKYGENAAVTLKGVDYETAQAFKAAIEDEVEKWTTSYEANTSINGETDKLSINWEWKYSGNSDTNDTLLGDSAVNHSFALTVGVTVEQID